ncbi:MAG: hypothetical protein RM049_10865 [Nostoc sp. DedQUE04]|uniref:hypothetical protein n=1 Tax=Nostoc sp. DedQUE04 TaxID=3075390 RepID=UPI002AD5486F|nr:hypothetical protein [Nostoc sp. DedQUE04]MDZ8135787.1 hypothetical protein [Nostoc sp. DedQUE04]
MKLLINSVGMGQAIVLDEVLRSLMKFAPGVTRSLVGMPVAVNYAMPNSRQCKDVQVV